MMKLAWAEQGNARALTFDATPGDTHLWSATVTEHPVEKGAAITDHVRAGAFRLSLDVIISNTPLSLPAGADDSFTDGVTRQIVQRDLGPGLGKATAYQWSAEFDRVRKVYEGLTDLIQDPPADGITVISTLALYDSMQIVNISVPRSIQCGTSAIEFTVDMQQVTIVESQTVDTLAPRIKPKHKGHKPTKEEPKKENVSFFHNLTGHSVSDTLGRLFGG